MKLIPLLLAAALTVFAAGPLVNPAQGQATNNDIDIELEYFGVASVYRPGDLTGIRLRLTNRRTAPGEDAIATWVQIEIPNADGDIVEYSRIVTLTRGRPTPVWLYVPLPPHMERDDRWPVRIFEMRDGRRRAELAGRRVGPRDVNAQREQPASSMIGVIGQRPMGLRDYSVLHDQAERSPAAHEFTRIVTGIRPDILPDRWEALHGYEAIAWAEASPRDLTSDTAGALREYVRHGGHLIVSLPEDTNPWQFGVRGQHPLEDILPQTEPRKDEAVPINELVPVLSKARGTPAEFTYGVRVFKDVHGEFDAIDNHYDPLIALPDGRVIVIRRTFGHGWITIVGVDLTQQRLYAVPLSNGSRGLPQADVFWNRILGRRIDTPLPTELEALRQADLLVRHPGAERNVGGAELVTQQIAMTMQAGMGLLLALLLFAGYWLLAGPGGFAILKLYGQLRHSWIMFAFASLAFTAVAWAAVNVLRINEPQVRHVTFLDHIARPDGASRPEDPQLQRAVSWFSLYTPGYLNTPIGVDSMPGRRNLLSSWTPPGDVTQTFPNVDRYSINVATSPSAYIIPSRSTATQLYANWVGGIDMDWGTMIQVDPNHPIEVIRQPDGREDHLRGQLTHGLPGTLRDVTVIWIRNARMPRRQYATVAGQEGQWVAHDRSGQVLNLGYMHRVPTWASGSELDLSELEMTPPAFIGRNIEQRYVDEYRPTRFAPTTLPTVLRPGDRRNFMEMLSIFHQLTPPTYMKLRADSAEPMNIVTFYRLLGRELDLSPWFTRPCVIIIGFLDDSPSPLPLRVNESDRAPESDGLTVVRWIYPLPTFDDIAFPQHDAEPPG